MNARKPRPRQGWGWPGLPKVIARMERERIAGLQTIPPPKPRSTWEWYEHLARTMRYLVSARSLDRYAKGLACPPDWLAAALSDLCNTDIYQLWDERIPRPTFGKEARPPTHEKPGSV